MARQTRGCRERGQALGVSRPREISFEETNLGISWFCEFVMSLGFDSAEHIVRMLATSRIANMKIVQFVGEVSEHSHVLFEV